MPTIWDHVVAVVIALAFPLRGALVLRGRLRAIPEAELPERQPTIYRTAATHLWTAALAVAALWIVYRRGWGLLGLVPVFNGGTIGILLGLVLVAAVALRQLRGGIDDAQARAMKKRVAGGERLLPRDARALRWFSMLAITAGICEEVVYRGFFIRYFQMLGLPLLPAAGVASVIFGVGHLYQGLRGVLTTTVAGVFLAGVYLLSGSLFPGILIHALMDLYAGHMLFAVYQREAAAAGGAVGGTPA